MAKMTDVAPETFIQGLGVYADDVDDALYGLGQYYVTEEDVLFNVAGLGSLALGQVRAPTAPRGKRAPAKKVPAMDAIVRNAAEMNAKMAAAAKARAALAQKNPVAAVKLAAAAKKTSAPGSNIARAVQQANNAAAKKALEAKKKEAEARKLLAQSDKRGAAAKAVAALTTARDAAILANKAEKTRITTGLDILKNTLKSQADYLTQQAKIEAARTGASPRTMALTATAQSLQKQGATIAAKSAVVAAMPTVPANAPSQQRIADLANRFNIRTARGDKQAMTRASTAVLGDLAENPMAQVNDYEGALSYYGVDGLGRLMADIEFENYESAFSGLAGAMGSIGYTDTSAILADGDRALAEGTALAQQAYYEVVLPASGLVGLGALGNDVEDAAWCDNAAKTGGINPADLSKCKQCPTPGGYIFGRCPAPGPNTIVGQAARGMSQDWVKKLTQTATSAVQTITNIVKPPPAAPPAPPPPQVKPPATIPTTTQAVQRAVTNLATQTQQAATAAYDTAKDVAGKIPMWAYAVGGVAVLGAGYFLLMKPKAMA